MKTKTKHFPFLSKHYRLDYIANSDSYVLSSFGKTFSSLRFVVLSFTLKNHVNLKTMSASSVKIDLILPYECSIG